MLGTREYTLCSPFRANAHNSSFVIIMVVIFTIFREYYVIEDKFPVDGLCWLLQYIIQQLVLIKFRNTWQIRWMDIFQLF